MTQAEIGSCHQQVDGQTQTAQQVCHVVSAIKGLILKDIVI